jgi:antitoxin component YwqK of YwqJK toxin-antitoxin module
MSKILAILLFFLGLQSSFAQDTLVKNGYQRFFYPNGKIASEGLMRNSKPDGYWKTYSDLGVLISEGNRLNYELDSTWIFYNSEKKLVLSVNYKNGKKNGIRSTYLPDKILVDSFENDLKVNWNYVLYNSGKIKSKIFFKNGIENGWSYHYTEDGRLIGKVLYSNGFIKKRESFNSVDINQKKQGIWKEFYNDSTVKFSGNYRNGIKDGYFKYYSKEGKLDSIEKYRNGILQEKPKELSVYEIRTDYYEDGSIKVIGSYRANIAEGIRREYSRDGKILDSYIMHQGIIVGHGIIDESGHKQGDWELFYDNGLIKAKGKYDKNKEIGNWIFYFENGNVEQTGSFDNNGNYNGEWKWFYQGGQLRISEQYYEGEREGSFVEYDSLGNVIFKGNYVRGLKEGEWISSVNGYIEVGTYLENVMDGLWQFYYAKDTLYYHGNFIDGSEDGVHTWYFRNGNIMKTGKYIMSLKNGEWRYFNEEGQLIVRVLYKDGLEMEYNSVKVDPQINLQDIPVE